MKNKKKISASEQRTLWGSRVVIWITMIVVLFPVIWIVMSSFSAGDSFFLSSLFPEKFSIEHYVELFRETDFGIWVFNSLKFCFIVAIIQLVLTSLAAYAFARLRFVGRKYGLMALLILQVFPNSMAVAGYYILIISSGWWTTALHSFLCLQVEVLTISGYLNLISMDFRWNWMKLQWWMEQMNSRFFIRSSSRLQCHSLP